MHDPSLCDKRDLCDKNTAGAVGCQRGFAHSKRISVLVRADWVRRAPWEQSDRQARSSGRFAPRSCGGAPPEIQPAFPSLGAAAVPHAPKPKASCQPHPSRRFSCSQIRPPRLCPSRDSPKIHPPRGWNPRPPCCSRISPIRGASSLKPPKVLGGGRYWTRTSDLVHVRDTWAK